MNQTPQTATIERMWEAVSGGDFDSLRSVLAPDAVWRPVDEDATCAGADTIVTLMSRNMRGRARGSIAEITQKGSRVIVGFRPADRGMADRRPLDEGVAYMVVSFEGSTIVELKGCADRAGAFAYARAGTTG